MIWLEIKRLFDDLLDKDEKVKKAVSKKKPTYKEAHGYAARIGDILGGIIATAENFPEGTTYEEAAAILDPALEYNYNKSKAVAQKAQKALNEKTGLTLNVADSKPKPGLGTGIAVEIAKAGGIKGIEAKIADQITLYTIKAVDDTVAVNAYEHQKLGLAPKVVRKAVARCCEWCSAMEGTYTPLEAEALGVYRRHDNCRCTVEYVVGNVSQTVHSGTEGVRKYTRTKSGKYEKRPDTSEKERAERIAKDKLAAAYGRK